MDEIYTISMEKLKEYLFKKNCMPSEKVWNRFAVEQNSLSSKTITYLSGIGFNKICRNMMKQINQNKKEL